MKGEQHCNAKITAEQVKVIRESKETGAAIARKYGISTASVSLIRSHKNWKHV